MATLIKSIRLSGDMIKRVKKSEISFVPGINLLIGPNGSGKTTFMDAMRDWRKSKNVEVKSNAGDFKAFSFEKDNPRTKPSGIATASSGDAVRSILALQMSSHGQTVQHIIGYLGDDEIQDMLILLDEPEQALDTDGLETLIQLLKKTKANQVIIATHSPFLILDPDFHIVELEDGYRNKIKDSIISLASICGTTTDVTV